MNQNHPPIPRLDLAPKGSRGTADIHHRCDRQNGQNCTSSLTQATGMDEMSLVAALKTLERHDADRTPHKKCVKRRYPLGNRPTSDKRHQITNNQ